MVILNIDHQPTSQQTLAYIYIYIYTFQMRERIAYPSRNNGKLNATLFWIKEN
jgi:hypothetical protein